MLSARTKSEQGSKNSEVVTQELNILGQAVLQIFGVLLEENRVQFAMCGSSGKYSPYKTVESLNTQSVLLLVNSAPCNTEKITKELDLGKKEIDRILESLSRQGLIEEAEGRYFPTFAIFTLRDQSFLKPLVKEISLGVKEIIEKRMPEVRDLISELECSKRGLKYPDLSYILIGAMTLDYGGLRVLRKEKLLLPGKKMPGDGNYIFSGLESGFMNLKEGWMWGHNFGFGKYWFSSHGKVPRRGFRMTFPDIAWEWTEHAEQKVITDEMEKIGEILEALSREDLSTRDLEARTNRDSARLLAELTLLLTLGYTSIEDKKWKINKPFFSNDDLERIDKLSEPIVKDIAEYFKRQKPQILRVYVQTSPSKNKVTFEEAFNLLYHLIFERTLNTLIESKLLKRPPIGQDKARYSSFTAIGIENLLRRLGLN